MGRISSAFSFLPEQSTWHLLGWEAQEDMQLAARPCIVGNGQSLLFLPWHLKTNGRHTKPSKKAY